MTSYYLEKYPPPPTFQGKIEDGFASGTELVLFAEALFLFYAF
jgi:hypothetical protein